MISLTFCLHTTHRSWLCRWLVELCLLSGWEQSTLWNGVVQLGVNPKVNGPQVSPSLFQCLVALPRSTGLIDVQSRSNQAKIWSLLWLNGRYQLNFSVSLHGCGKQFDFYHLGFVQNKIHHSLFFREYAIRKCGVFQRKIIFAGVFPPERTTNMPNVDGNPLIKSKLSNFLYLFWLTVLCFEVCSVQGRGEMWAAVKQTCWLYGHR